MFIRYHIHGIFYEKIKTIIIHVKEMHVNVSKIHIKAHIAILPGVVSVLFFCFKLRIFKFKNANDSIKVNSIIPVEYDDSDYDMRYEYRDRERELYERDRDRELERERYFKFCFQFSNQF